jgi:pantoate--beta-alanine ligase
MIVARTIAEARAARPDLPDPFGLVPTMGALHEGHFTLLRAARERCASVALSLFVNPTQFTEPDDFESYPRAEERDLELAESEGVDLVFAPSPDDMYRPDAATLVHVVGPLTEELEATVRPGHFDAVATIVAKLFAILSPDLAFFGRKDAQQLAVVQRMTDDLDFPVEIVPIETVRERDGLALSSRNAQLSDAARAKAADFYRALLSGRAVAADGPQAIVDEATSKLILGFPPYLEAAGDKPLFSVDYVQVVDPRTFERQWELTPESLIVAAVQIGKIRLLDNLPVFGESPAVEPRYPDALSGQEAGLAAVGADAERPAHDVEPDAHDEIADEHSLNAASQQDDDQEQQY